MSTYGSVLSGMFLDLINDTSLVHLPTRLNNTLDLVFCTYPKIANLSTVPDHDAILDINRHSMPSAKKHKIALYHKGKH